MIWPPDRIYLSPDGDQGPVFWRHRNGIVCGHPGRVTVMSLVGEDGMHAWWYVSNRDGAYNTMAMAIKLYDPFQGTL